MRNLKKVLTLVLTVAMLLSVMVVGTGAAFSDQDSIKNKEAVDVCTTLNIIAGMEDGSYRPANNVTRAQMCKMICVALNGGKEPTLGTNNTPTFNDVRTDATSKWAESFIESCYSQGIVSGVGSGRFNPSGSVTGTQAARMLLVALGYRADLAGFTGDSWAINVNTAASAKGLYKGIESIDANAALSRDNAAQMIWNALNAYEVEYVSQLITDKDGKLTSTLVPQDKVVGGTRDKITLLEDKYESKTFTGTFLGNDKVCNLDDGNIRVYGSVDDATAKGNANFKYDLDLKYIGEEVKVLFKDGTGGTKDRPDNKDTIYGVYVTGATKVYNITKSELQNQKENGTVRFGDSNYDVASAKEDFEYINYNYGAKNVSATGAMTADKVADDMIAKLQETSADTIKFICDSNGDIEKAYVVESKLARVTAVNKDSVSLNNGIGTIKIDDNSIYSDVAKDDIVVATTLYKELATTSGAYTTIEKADTAENKLTAYNGTKSVSVDGTAYDVYKDNIGANKGIDSDFVDTFANQIGETVRVYLIGGIVYAAEMVTEASQYAVIEAQTGNALGDTFNPIKVKIMKTDGSEATVELHKDSTTDGTTKIAGTGNVPTGALIKYSDVSDGKIKISKVSTVIDNTIANAATATVDTVYDKDTKSFATTANGGDKKVTSSDTIVFVNRNDDFYHYTVRNLNDITVTGNTSGAAATYKTSTIVDDSGKVVVAYVTLGSKPSGASSTTVYGIVSSENGTTKVGDDTYTSYTVQVDDVRDNDKTVLIEGANDTTMKEGDLVAFDLASDDVYSSKDVKVYARMGEKDLALNHAATAVFADEYDEAGQILTYFTGTANDNNEIKGTGATTKAVDKDVKIIYVDAGDDVASSDVGISEFDNVTAKKNIVLVFDEDNASKSVVAIFVDIDRNIER